MRVKRRFSTRWGHPYHLPGACATCRQTRLRPLCFIPSMIPERYMEWPAQSTAEDPPDVFTPMIDRLAAFVVPYQQAMGTEAAQRNLHLYLQGLLSHLPSKNAEDIATFVNVERLVIQEFIGTAPWDHRPLIEVLVPQVAHRLGQPDGILAVDPSSFPKRGTHSVGVKRQWCGHRGKVDNCQVGVFMGY